MRHAANLGFSLPEADVGKHEQSRARFAMALEDCRREMGGHVRHVLRPLLLMGKGKMEDVAARLGLHVRALRRRLWQEGTSVEGIKDEMRYAAARELLDHTSLESLNHRWL